MESLVEKLGLSTTAIRSTGGLLGAKHLRTTLSHLLPVSRAAASSSSIQHGMQQSLVAALLEWQQYCRGDGDGVERKTKDFALETHYLAFLEVIQKTLLESFDEDGIVDYVLIALDLSEFLLLECQDNSLFAEDILFAVASTAIDVLPLIVRENVEVASSGKDIGDNTLLLYGFDVLRNLVAMEALGSFNSLDPSYPIGGLLLPLLPCFSIFHLYCHSLMCLFSPFLPSCTQQMEMRIGFKKY